MSKAVWWGIVLGGLILFGNIIYMAVTPAPDLNLHLPSRAQPPAAPAPAPAEVADATPPAADAPPAEGEVRYPVEPPPQEKPLPPIDKSDGLIRAALNDLLRNKAFVDLFQPIDFVRHVAATIDNIPRQKIAQRLMPTKPAAGAFAVTGRGDNVAIDSANGARYAAFMRLLDALDTEKAVSMYVRFYPLFQRAYEELGYPKYYFNDRVIAAIDHLLATPDVKGPIKLIRPKVLYLYADPELEALSAGQKAMIRTGSANAAKIKAKLREIRSELLRQVKGRAGAR